jgi:hypothetical protein
MGHCWDFRCIVLTHNYPCMCTTQLFLANLSKLLRGLEAFEMQDAKLRRRAHNRYLASTVKCDFFKMTIPFFLE